MRRTSDATHGSPLAENGILVWAAPLALITRMRAWAPRSFLVRFLLDINPRPQRQERYHSLFNTPSHHLLSFTVMDSEEVTTFKDKTGIWTDAVGDPSNPSVVFIPGVMSDSQVFDKQFEDPKLAKDLYLVRHLLRLGYLVLTPKCEGSIRPSRTG